MSIQKQFFAFLKIIYHIHINGRTQKRNNNLICYVIEYITFLRIRLLRQVEIGRGIWCNPSWLMSYACLHTTRRLQIQLY